MRRPRLGRVGPGRGVGAGLRPRGADRHVRRPGQPGPRLPRAVRRRSRPPDRGGCGRVRQLFSCPAGRRTWSRGRAGPDRIAGRVRGGRRRPPRRGHSSGRSGARGGPRGVILRTGASPAGRILGVGRRRATGRAAGPARRAGDRLVPAAERGRGDGRGLRGPGREGPRAGGGDGTGRTGARRRAARSRNPDAVPEGGVVNEQASGATVAIVDPVSGGKFLASEFARRGWSAVAVLSRPTLPEFYTAQLCPDDFLDVIQADGDVDEVLARLAAYQVRAVLPGAETGVALADELAERLCLVGNGTALSAHRRDKYLMMDVLAAKGIPVPESGSFDTAADLVAWTEAGPGWPVVIKPRRSCGTDSVYFCQDAERARAAVAAIVGQINVIGELNDSVCVQRLVTGDQYFVNTISRAGRHSVCEIWQDRKRALPGRSLVYDIEELVPYGVGPTRELVSYVKSVLDALALTEGPAHTEVMWTAEGPMLIELNARVQGSIITEPVTAALGHNHVTRTVDAVTDPDSFLATVDEPYHAARRLRAVSLIAPDDGQIGDPSLLCTELIPTFAGVMGDVRAGRPVQRTVDLFSSPGCVYLLADTDEEIERDTARIRAIERDGLYAPR
ncbi:ATP-grasp domain-containing protein [Micromonospora sp. KC721]|nr:ATP-grasp domain-containing protein [Micromonospora sp. KC721]